MIDTIIDLLPAVLILMLAYGFHLLVKYTTKLEEDNAELSGALRSMDKTICALQAKCWDLEKRLRVFEDIVRSHKK